MFAVYLDFPFENGGWSNDGYVLGWYVPEYIATSSSENKTKNVLG